MPKISIRKGWRKVAGKYIFAPKHKPRQRTIAKADLSKDIAAAAACGLADTELPSA